MGKKSVLGIARNSGFRQRDFQIWTGFPFAYNGRSAFNRYNRGSNIFICSRLTMYDAINISEGIETTMYCTRLIIEGSIFYLLKTHNVQ